MLHKARSLATLISAINLSENLCVHRCFRCLSLRCNQPVLTRELCDLPIVEWLLSSLVLKYVLSSVGK